MPPTIYFDHNTVQHEFMGRLLDDPQLGTAFHVVVSEAHWFETLLCCGTVSNGERVARVPQATRDAIVRRLANDYLRAIRTDRDLTILDWPRQVRGFLETLASRGDVELREAPLVQTEAAIRRTSIEGFRKLRDDSSAFDEEAYRDAVRCREHTAYRQTLPRSAQYYAKDALGDVATNAPLWAPIEDVVRKRRSLVTDRRGVDRAKRREIEQLALNAEAEHRDATVALVLMLMVDHLNAHLRRNGIAWSDLVRAPAVRDSEMHAFLHEKALALPCEYAPPSTRLAAAVALMQVRRSTMTGIDERPQESNALDALHVACAAGADIFCTDDVKLRAILGELAGDVNLAPLLPVVVSESENELRARIDEFVDS